jgi:hypothetical protein
MDIWHIENKNLPTIILWKNDHDNFHVIEKGSAGAILTHHNYSLIDERYASLISKLPTQVSFHKATVLDFVLKREYHNYIALDIVNTIDPENIKNKNSEGLKIWRFGGEVFVSGELKDELLKIGPGDFIFTQGFQFFGGFNE